MKALDTVADTASRHLRHYETRVETLQRDPRDIERHWETLCVRHFETLSDRRHLETLGDIHCGRPRVFSCIL